MSEHDIPFGFEDNAQRPTLDAASKARCKHEKVEWKPLREYQLSLTYGKELGVNFVQTAAAACFQPTNNFRSILDQAQTNESVVLFANSLEVCEFKAEQLAQIWLANHDSMTREAFIKNHVSIVPKIS
jgi:hypothetical protein